MSFKDVVVAKQNHLLLFPAKNVNFLKIIMYAMYAALPAAQLFMNMTGRKEKTLSTRLLQAPL